MAEQGENLQSESTRTRPSLDELIAKLEAADEGSRTLDGDIAEALPDVTGLAEAQRRNANTLKRHHCGQPHQWGRSTPTWERWTPDCYTTDLHDALALMPGGWFLAHMSDGVSFEPRQPDSIWFLTCSVELQPTYDASVEGDGATRALAACIAALKARRDN